MKISSSHTDLERTQRVYIGIEVKEVSESVIVIVF